MTDQLGLFPESATVVDESKRKLDGSVIEFCTEHAEQRRADEAAEQGWRDMFGGGRSG